jgi:hypothetical protein
MSDFWAKPLLKLKHLSCDQNNTNYFVFLLANYANLHTSFETDWFQAAMM